MRLMVFCVFQLEEKCDKQFTDTYSRVRGREIIFHFPVLWEIWHIIKIQVYVSILIRGKLVCIWN